MEHSLKQSVHNREIREAWIFKIGRSFWKSSKSDICNYFYVWVSWQIVNDQLSKPYVWRCTITKNFFPKCGFQSQTFVANAISGGFLMQSSGVPLSLREIVLNLSCEASVTRLIQDPRSGGRRRRILNQNFLLNIFPFPLVLASVSVQHDLICCF